MNNMVLAALCGFVFIEARAVRLAARANGEKFSLEYYLNNNGWLLLSNAAGCTMLYLLSPGWILAERFYLMKHYPELDPQMVSDLVLAPLTGGLIGCVGPWLLRTVITLLKKWFRKFFGKELGDNDQ